MASFDTGPMLIFQNTDKQRGGDVESWTTKMEKLPTSHFFPDVFIISSFPKIICNKSS